MFLYRIIFLWKKSLSYKDELREKESGSVITTSTFSDDEYNISELNELFNNLSRGYSNTYEILNKFEKDALVLVGPNKDNTYNKLGNIEDFIVSLSITRQFDWKVEKIEKNEQGQIKELILNKK